MGRRLHSIATGGLAVVLASYLFSLFVSASGESFWRGVNDFAAFYQGGQLAGTGRLYDTETQLAWQREQLGGQMRAVTFIRLPFYGLMLKPFARLDYIHAWMVFLLINIGCAAWFYWTFLRNDPAALLPGVSYLPSYAALVNGQDVWIVASLFAHAVRLADSGAPFRAGLVFSLCAVKPHLFAFVPVVLAIHGRWRWLAGAATGGSILLGLSFLAEGPDWPERFLAELSDPRVHARPEVMPTLRSLAAAVGAPPFLFWLLAAVTAAAVIWTAFSKQGLEAALAAALAAGLLLNYHAYIADMVLLLPAFALLRKRGLVGPPFWAWVLLFSPVPFLLFVRGGGLAAALPLAIFAGLLSIAALNPAKTGASRDIEE